ncbi:HEAT repeat domain-containing protein [Thermomonospora umbrina]|uniref:HEAT repeat protein n=1 Tax=Thermomonospora umbrina TaxID=111806 RepID=A0A3D9SLL4_9ACTN|nr:HEAT repeat domain-containing protein [Thermomonospora umbrina]REE96826.1 HEAT repeat protein [Thermomonospora umbrina]
MIAEHQVAFFLREIRSADAGRRAAAAKGLSRAPGHVTELVALASDPDPTVRAAAALGLGRQGEGVPIEPLVTLCSDPDSEVRRRAVNTLDRLGATRPSVDAAFRERLGDVELRNRPAVLVRLLRSETPVPAESLVPLLADADSMVWGPARMLLRLLPEADAVFADLVRTGSAEVRERALDMLASPRAGIPGMRPDAEPETRETAWHRFWGPEPAVVRALSAALEAETEPYARNVLFRVLADRRVPEVVPQARAWLADPECGHGAAKALAGAGTVEAVDLLRTFATGPGPQGDRQRGTALRELGAAGGVDDAELLFGLLGDGAEEVRRGAVDGLGAFFRRFDGSLHGRLEQWRAERVPGLPVPPPSDDPAVRGLARRSAERLTRMLVDDVEHADGYHDALWHIPEVRPFLPALLGHPDGRVRSTALHLAERFEDIDYAGRLHLLDDAHHAVRQGAAMGFLLLALRHGLTEAERDDLRPHLVRAQDDSDHYVRTYTAKTLAHLNGA